MEVVRSFQALDGLEEDSKAEVLVFPDEAPPSPRPPSAQGGWLQEDESDPAITGKKLSEYMGARGAAPFHLLLSAFMPL